MGTLVDRQTGEISRAAHAERRLEDALVRHPHNCLRIRRILACLAVVGFKDWMVPLVAFLEWESRGNNQGCPFENKVPWPSDQGLLYSLPDDAVDCYLQYVDGNPSTLQRMTRATPEELEQKSVLLCDTE